jgi:CO/xanthine dehydrogenase Mo-binding subunit
MKMPKIGEIKEVTWENKPTTQYVGKYIDDLQAPAVVTGKTEYVADIQLPGMLYVKIKRSTACHSNIKKVDTSAAKNMPGVHAVLTAEDIDYMKVFGDEPILAWEKTRYYGEPIAMVVAETEEIAENALELISVEYEELTPIFDPEEAASLTPPVIVHEPKLVHSELEDERPNLMLKTQVRKGDLEKGFAESDVIIENVYYSPYITHAAMEPMVSVADYDAAGEELTIWESSQTTYSVHHPVIAGAVDMPGDKVRFLIPAKVGGAFGGKNMPQAGLFAAWAAKVTGRPVIAEFSREGSHLCVSRPSWRIYIKDGVTNDGVIKAREINVYCGGGAYVRFNFDLAKKAATMPAGDYNYENYSWNCYISYTNDQPMLSLRSFSIQEIAHAVEAQMDVLAKKLGIDLIEFRKKNFLPEGEKNVLNEIQGGVNTIECLERVTNDIGWTTPKASSGGSWKRGRGLAAGNMYIHAGLTKPLAMVRLSGSGDAEVITCVSDMGTVAITTMAMIAADALNIPIERVKALPVDTRISTYTGSAFASQQAFHAGGAVYEACKDAKKQLFDTAAPLLNAKPEDLETKDGQVFVKGAPENSIPWGQLMQGDLPLLIGIGEIFMPSDGYDPETGQAIPDSEGNIWYRRYTLYGHSAQACEVDVNTDTGEVKIIKTAHCIDCRPINLAAVEGQMIGGMGSMGLGPAMLEEQIHDKGRYLNLTFLDYKMLTSLDLPGPNNTFIDYAPHKGWQTMGIHIPTNEGPFYGGRGAGELVIVPSLALLENAIEDAIGVRIKETPVTPARVLEALGKA